MYDTLFLWLPEVEINDVHYIERMAGLLNVVTEHKRLDGRKYITGTVLDMNACCSDKGISLKGSICKSLYGNNLKTLTIEDTKRAIENLSDILSLPINNATTSRIDVAYNFELSQLPERYFQLFGDCPHYKRLEQPKSLYYVNGLRTKHIYNKIAEVKSRHEVLEEIWKAKNLLRYELRFTSRLPLQFNQTKVQAKDLISEKFYSKIIERWVQEYENINKNSLINFNLKNMNSPKDFINQMALLKINELGQPKAFEMVEILRANNSFAKPEYYSRLKADIKRLCKTEGVTEVSSLIMELDDKVKDIKDHCL